MPRSNVVITGLGVVSSIGIGGEAFFESLLQKRSGICSLAQRTDDNARPAVGDQNQGFWIGGPILDFDPKLYVRPRKSLKVMCREIQTAFASSQLAIENADLSNLLPADPSGTIQPSQVGTVFGSEMFYGTPAEMVDALEACRNAQAEIDGSQFGTAAMKNIMPLWMLKYLPNMPACHVGIAINSHGPNNTLVLGDISGPAATIEAACCIDRGTSSLMIAGATGTRISTTRLNYRGNLPIADAFDPIEHSSRPHDPTAAGVVGGEGSAAVILESAELAGLRGAQPLAYLVAYANVFVPSNGLTGKSTDPLRGSSIAIGQAIEITLRDANIQPAEIGLVVSHACGDRQMDLAERVALQAALPEVPVVAPIALLGHCGAASGSISLITAILSLVKQTIPPTLQVKTTSPEINFRDTAEPIAAPLALVLTHSAEGNATAILLRAKH